MAKMHRADVLGLCLGAVLLAGLVMLLHRTGAGDGAEPAGSGGRPRDETLTIRIAHDGAGCGRPCREDSHWSVHVRDRLMTDREQLRKALQAQAEGMRTDPDRPQESQRQVLVASREDSPWGLVQRAIHECAKVGIYKIDWSVPERGTDASLVRAWLPRRFELGGTRCGPIRAEIQVFLKRDPAAAESLRKVGNRGMVGSDEEMMKIIVEYVRDFQKAGQAGAPVLIDATPDVPWKDVLHVMDLCRKEKLDTFEFAAPFGEIERRQKK